MRSALSIDDLRRRGIEIVEVPGKQYVATCRFCAYLSRPQPRRGNAVGRAVQHSAGNGHRRRLRTGVELGPTVT